VGFLEVHLDNDDFKTDEEVSFETDEETSGQISYFLSSAQDLDAERLAAVSFYDLHTSVDFLHRTAADFLRQNKLGKNFLEQYLQSNVYHCTSYIRALLTKIRLVGFAKMPTAPTWHFGKQYCYEANLPYNV